MAGIPYSGIDILTYPKGVIMSDLSTATVSQLAGLIVADYKGRGKALPYSAVPYVDAMRSLQSVSDNYGYDDGRSIVAYALSNLTVWRGETAKAVKAELKRRIA
jgi:hypothetical protein